MLAVKHLNLSFHTYCYRNFLSRTESMLVFYPRWGGKGRGDGDARRKFSKNTLKGTRISFDGCGSNDFSLLRGTKSKTTHVIFCQIVLAQYPKRFRDNSNGGHFSVLAPQTVPIYKV